MKRSNDSLDLTQTESLKVGSIRTGSKAKAKASKSRERLQRLGSSEVRDWLDLERVTWSLTLRNPGWQDSQPWPGLCQKRMSLYMVCESWKVVYIRIGSE